MSKVEVKEEGEAVAGAPANSTTGVAKFDPLLDKKKRTLKRFKDM